MTVAGHHAVEEQLRRAAGVGEPGGGVDQNDPEQRGGLGGTRGAELLYVDAGRGRGALVNRARQLGIAVRRVSARQLDEVARREAFGGSSHASGRHDGVVLRLPGGRRVPQRPRGDRHAGSRDGDGWEGARAGRRDESLRDWLRVHLERSGGADLLILALDGITDPMNLGSILRSADQFGADLVLLPRRRSAPISATVHRASAGAAAHVAVREVPNLDQALTELRREEVWIYGADMAGEPVATVRLSRRAALVLGAEGSGLHRLTRQRCDQLLRVPTQGAVDSLNVGVAAGVLMYEMRRQWALADGG